MVEAYPVALVIVGLAIFGAVVLPRMLLHQPLSMPIIYVVAGYLIFAVPHGVGPPDMVGNSVIVEHLTELVVIIALMGAGLKIDKPFSWTGWSTTWRLLGITMPLTIAATAILGHTVLNLHVATAVLLGAVIAPTDPVLASDIESGPPLTQVEEDEEAETRDDRREAGHEDYPKSDAHERSHPEPDTHERSHPEPDAQERTVRFSLTSEAGLNDGLAFPFTYLAIALAAATSVSSFTWAPDWVLVDVLYRIVVGVVVGYVLGYAGGLIIFRLPASSRVARAMEGAEALSGTLVIYGVTEVLHGYGFIAVFVGALVLRNFEWEHDYYRTLNDYAVMVERLLMSAVLVLFGGALAGGLLDPLSWMEVGIGLAVLLVVRPFAGLVGLVGTDLAWPSRGVIAGYGIRGIGSFYYLSFALNEATFQEFELVIAAERLWALVGFVVLSSIVLHGVTASKVMDAFHRWEGRQRAIGERRTPGD